MLTGRDIHGENKVNGDNKSLLLASLSSSYMNQNMYSNRLQVHVQGPFGWQEGQLAGEREQIAGDICGRGH